MTDDDDARLEALGIHVALPGVRDECIRVARRILHAQRKIVGLLPASAAVGVTSVGVQLGLALGEITGATIAFVDANVRWPAVSELAARRGHDSERPDARTSAYATRFIRGSLALLTPPRPGDAGAGVPQLARVIEDGSDRFRHMLVDLTGFKKLGEHLAAIEMVDGVVVVGRAGRTTEDELLQLNHELPAQHLLGVLLIG